MTLFSDAAELVSGNSYADRRMRPTTNLNQPHLCILGAGTPEHFFEALQSGALKDGFLPRFIVFRPDEYLPPRVKNPMPLEISPAMIQIAQKIAGACSEDGNLSGVLQMQHDQPYSAHVVRYTADGEAEHERFMDRREDIQQRGCVGFAPEQLVGKWSEHAIKLSMIRAISRDPSAPVMDRDMVNWGWCLSEHCITGLGGMAERHMSENDTEAEHKFVRGIIADAGGTGIMKRDLIRKTERLGTKKLGMILDAIIEGGWITSEKLAPGPSGGRPGFRFKIVA